MEETLVEKNFFILGVDFFGGGFASSAFRLLRATDLTCDRSQVDRPKKGANYAS